MKNLYQQTTQAFYFSLIFYLGAIVFFLLKVSVAPFLFSFALLVSLIWVFLAIREIMLSPRVANSERLLLVIFIIMLNVFAGLIYFFLLRKRVILDQNIK